MRKLIDLSTVNGKLLALFFIMKNQNGETERGISVGTARLDGKHLSIDYKAGKESTLLPDEILSLIHVVDPELRSLFCNAEFFIPLIAQSLPDGASGTVAIDVDESVEAQDQGMLLDHHEWKALLDELRAETPRAMVILIAAYIDVLLERKLKQLFYRGNSKTRSKLFNRNGPFASFSAKMDAAYCLGWLDSDVFNDIELIRQIRNRFAHQIHGLSLESDEIKKLTERFKLPRKQTNAMGMLLRATNKIGYSFVLIEDDPPDGIKILEDPSSESLFRFVSTLIISHLVANLKITVLEHNGNAEASLH